MENLSLDILSKITHFQKYAKYIPSLGRRETFEETVYRYLDMMKKKYPSLVSRIDEYGRFIFEMKILPAMRCMQFAGKPIERNESRCFNCSYLPITDPVAFSEVIFLLLGGCGVGYSVQFHHIRQLPEIRKPRKEQKYLIGDSIEGWADAVRHLIASYFGLRSTRPRFDFSDIRPKGTRLVTAGGKAPGPEPLRRCLFNIEQMLERKDNGDNLTSLEVHDIICYVADTVLAGGIRRAALISLFSADDESMLTCKYGKWWELNPQRGRANNSAVLLRHRVKKDFFDNLWERIRLSGCGEPGIHFTHNPDLGSNPCHEISLRPFSFCNLTEINGSTVKDQQDFNNRAEAASFFGTLQAGFTDFHYLRPIWRKTAEQDALIGVGITGIASEKFLSLDERSAAEIVKTTNEYWAGEINIRPAARTTCIKPSGSTSCILGTSSGIHAWHSEYYIRRIQLSKSEDLYKYLKHYNPSLVQDHELISDLAVLEVPIKSPPGAVVRDTELAINLLERVKRLSENWVRTGHRSGDDYNNVSATITVKPDEWSIVREWMWKNREFYNGLAILPHDLGTYSQAPFESISKATYYRMLENLRSVDLTKVREDNDNTSTREEIACTGGTCEII